MTLDQLSPGETGRITGLDFKKPCVRRLAEMGFINGQVIALIRTAPFGEPYHVRLMNYEVCIRKSEASAIQVERIEGSLIA